MRKGCTQVTSTRSAEVCLLFVKLLKEQTKTTPWLGQNLNACAQHPYNYNASNKSNLGQLFRLVRTQQHGTALLLQTKNLQGRIQRKFCFKSQRHCMHVGAWLRYAKHRTCLHIKYIDFESIPAFGLVFNKWFQYNLLTFSSVCDTV